LQFENDIYFHAFFFLVLIEGVFTAVTDGAVNRLVKNYGDRKDEFIPTIVTGDFDSASPDNLDYYRNKVYLYCESYLFLYVFV